MSDSSNGSAVHFVSIPFPPEGDRLLALNPRGTRLAVSWQNSDQVQVFDTRSGADVARCTDFFRVSGVEFLSAEVLLVAAFGGCFRCDLRRGRRDLLSAEGWQTYIAVCRGGRVVAIGVRGGLDLFDVRKGQVVRRLGMPLTYNHYGNCVAFSRRGRYVAVEFRNDGDREMPLVVVWDAKSRRRMRFFDTEAHALAFREDSLTLAVADDHGRILLFEPDQGEQPAREFKPKRPWTGVCGRALQFRDEGRTLAVLLGNGECVQVETDSGRVVRRLPPPADYEPYSVAASADWSLFAGATDSGVVVWPGGHDMPKGSSRRRR